MRNIFDQYTQPENRVTHALMCALHHDPTLLHAFLRDIAQFNPSGRSSAVAISEQIYPGVPTAEFVAVTATP